MSILIGSSYFDNGKGGREFRQKFAKIWSENNASSGANKVVIVCEGRSVRPETGCEEQVVELFGDLGHVHDHISGKKKYQFTGWSASMIACAMLAYTNESDFIYKEEDCLAFGPWVKQMYDDMGFGQMVFGKKHTSPPWMACSQSLFLVRHDFIPYFIATYLSLGKDGQIGNLGEDKFVKIEQKFGTSTIKRLSFGVDRERPIPYDNSVFYAQQFNPNEIQQLKSRNLI